MAWLAEAVRYGRRLLWIAVPTLALAAIVVVARSDKPAGQYADRPHAKVRFAGCRAIVIAGDDLPTGTLHNVQIPRATRLISAM
jgi:hypothetical protein